MRLAFPIFLVALSSCGEQSYCLKACDFTVVKLPAVEQFNGSYELRGTLGAGELTREVRCSYQWGDGVVSVATLGCSDSIGVDASTGITRVSVSGLYEPANIELTRDGVRVYKIDFTNPTKVTTPSCNRTGCRSWTFNAPSA